MAETRQMPGELVDKTDGGWPVVAIRADRMTRGKARAFFADEYGEGYTDPGIVKTYYRDPGPRCDCEAEATCGVSSTGGWGETFNHLTCADCQQDLLDRLADALPISLEDATPYDGWDMVACDPGEPGATAYWERRDA